MRNEALDVERYKGHLPYNVMILPSQDGQDHAYAILYPETWSTDEADAKAEAVFDAVKEADPGEWDWDDCEEPLQAAGFVIPLWHHGPIWD
jgi:hypothetical protein